MSPTNRSPTAPLPCPLRPSLGSARVSVAPARTCGSCRRPVDSSSPEGTSNASTRRPVVQAMSLAASPRGVPDGRWPRSASSTSSGSPGSSTTDAVGTPIVRRIANCAAGTGAICSDGRRATRRPSSPPPRDASRPPSLRPRSLPPPRGPGRGARARHCRADSEREAPGSAPRSQSSAATSDASPLSRASASR